MAELPPLGAHVRATLVARHGSMAQAAEQLDISYERLKKAVQRNRFSANDIETLVPGARIEDLRSKFSFNFARRGELVGSAPPPFDLFSTIEVGYRLFQRGVREIEFSKFVSDLYDKIGTDLAVQAMVLFCDRTTPPIEWSSEQTALMSQLAHALDQGAKIIYVMETDLVGMGSDNVEKDLVDKQFERYLHRLDLWREGDQPANRDGFVALVRVRHCSFCVPFQKQTLFVCLTDDLEPNRYHALTTIDVPELSSGVGHLGTAAVPQEERVANAMRDYLLDLVLSLQDGEPDKADFHFTAFEGPKSPASFQSMSDTLEKIAKYP